MRLIDADALKIDFYDEYETEDDAYAYGYVSKHQIDMAPTIDAVSVEWISCDERSPSENGYYLCCNKGYLPYVGHYQNGRWIDFDCTILHADAWMPLPQPYGERKESE